MWLGVVHNVIAYSTLCSGSNGFFGVALDPALEVRVQEEIDLATEITANCLSDPMDESGITDLIYNHITARVPGSDERLPINL